MKKTAYDLQRPIRWISTAGTPNSNAAVAAPMRKEWARYLYSWSPQKERSFLNTALNWYLVNGLPSKWQNYGWECGRIATYSCSAVTGHQVASSERVKRIVWAGPTGLVFPPRKEIKTDASTVVMLQNCRSDIDKMESWMQHLEWAVNSPTLIYSQKMQKATLPWAWHTQSGKSK